jgi:hypothetical protein
MSTKKAKELKQVSIIGDPANQLTIDLVCMTERIGLLATVIRCDSRVHPEVSYANSQWTYIGREKSIRGLRRTEAYRALARYQHCG